MKSRARGLRGLFAEDPITQPLAYPGRIPQTPGLFAGDRYSQIRVVDGEPAHAWILDDEGEAVQLDERLAQLEAAPMEDRHRVIAVGSNAAPGQLYRKFLNQAVRPIIPLTHADVTGLAPGVSAHISMYGYVPAVPIALPGTVSRLFVLWLDDAQIEILDATEPNYDRRVLPGDSYPVTLVSGVPLPECQVYVGKHGCLADGSPLPLENQRSLIARLLTASPALAKLCGESPEEFVERASDVAVREAAYDLFRAEGLALPQPDLTRLPAARTMETAHRFMPSRRVPLPAERGEQPSAA